MKTKWPGITNDKWVWYSTSLKYAHHLTLSGAVLWWDVNHFYPFVQDYFTGIETIIWLPQYQIEQLECLCYEIPPTTPWLPILVIHIRFQVKTRQSQSYKFKKKIAKNSNLKFCKKTLHMANLLKLLDKMYEYKRNPTRTVGTTERPRDGWTDTRMDGVKPIYPPTTLLCGV